MIHRKSFRAIGTGITRPCLEKQVEYSTCFHWAAQKIFLAPAISAVSFLLESFGPISGGFFQCDIPAADERMVLRHPSLSRASCEPDFDHFFVWQSMFRFLAG
jgi:hypothetical protein